MSPESIRSISYEDRMTVSRHFGPICQLNELTSMTPLFSAKWQSYVTLVIPSGVTTCIIKRVYPSDVLQPQGCLVAAPRDTLLGWTLVDVRVSLASRFLSGTCHW